MFLEYGVDGIRFKSRTFTNALQELEDTAISPMSTRGQTVITAAVIRSGSTKKCELYLYWTGTDYYNSFRYKQIVVKSTAILFPTIYETFGNGSSYTTHNVPMSESGHVKIGNLDIDTGVNTVKVTSSGLQGYNVGSLAWLSAKE